MTSKKDCFKCKARSVTPKNGIRCVSSCGRWWHVKCAGLTTKRLRDGSPWTCEECIKDVNNEERLGAAATAETPAGIQVNISQESLPSEMLSDGSVTSPTRTRRDLRASGVFSVPCDFANKLTQLQESVQAILDQQRELNSNFSSQKKRLDEFEEKFAGVPEAVSRIRSLIDEREIMGKRITELERQVDALDQRNRSNNVEIRGLPYEKTEDLPRVVEAIARFADVELTRNDFSFCERSARGVEKQSQANGQPAPVVVTFARKEKRDEFLRKTRMPPHQMMVYDASGRDVAGVVGPLEEGSALVLVCEVRGGRPEPTVTWHIGSSLAPQYLGVKSDTHVVVNRLELARVRREDLNTTYKCRASNTDLVGPQEKSVRLELNLAPRSVALLAKPSRLAAGSAVTLRCAAEGSRPPAQLSWTMDNRPLGKAKIVESTNETWTLNTLTFTPLPEHDGVQVRCSADNPALPSNAIDDHFKLNVVYPPVVSLSLGSTLNPNDIKEGDDVYFECAVKANPREHRISWYHDVRQVTQNMTSGIILSTKSLVLQKVTRHESGGYSCRAANARGETSSEVVRLRVQFAPVCSARTATVVGAALDEALRVRCSVAADPAEVNFLWQFNNSGESFDVSPARYAGTANGSTSELRYTPASERDYGTLSCRGTNTVGRQAQPCVFQIVPAVRPSPPRNCTVRASNTSSSWSPDGTDWGTGGWLQVRCVAGYDGGVPQHLVLEALDPVTGKSRLNTTANDTDGMVLFHMDTSELWPAESATSLNLVIHARNLKGASDRIIIENIAYNDAERRTDGGASLIAGVSVVALAVVALGGTLGCGALLGGAVALRRRRARAIPPKLPPSNELLELSAGRQYVVAYTLKTSPTHEARPQPDILNPQRDNEAQESGRDREDYCSMNGGPAPVHVDESEWCSPRAPPRPSPLRPLYLLPAEAPPDGTIGNMIPPSSGSMADFSGTIPHRRRSQAPTKHLLTDDIPGPESCV